MWDGRHKRATACKDEVKGEGKKTARSERCMEGSVSNWGRSGGKGEKKREPHEQRTNLI